MDEVLTQVWLLVDCIKKKNEELGKILALTNKQTEVIINSPSDNQSFNALVMQKKEFIDKANDLDNIFANIYERVKDFMGKGNLDYRDAMIELQDNIKIVTDLTVKIKTIEEKNARVLTGGVRKPPKKLVTKGAAMAAYSKNKKF